MPNKTNDGAHGIVIRFFLFSFYMKTLLKKVTNYILTCNSCVSLFSQSHISIPHVTLGNKNCDLIYSIIEERLWTKNMDRTSTFKIIVTVHFRNFVSVAYIRASYIQKVIFKFCLLTFSKNLLRLSIFSILFNYYFFILTLTFFGSFL